MPSLDLGAGPCPHGACILVEISKYTDVASWMLMWLAEIVNLLNGRNCSFLFPECLLILLRQPYLWKHFNLNSEPYSLSPCLTSKVRYICNFHHCIAPMFLMVIYSDIWKQVPSLSPYSSVIEIQHA